MPGTLAESLFAQGRAAASREDWPLACEKFTASQALDPAAGTLMNLADCEERVGQLASAWQHWREALSLLPADDSRVRFARERVAALQPKLPKLRLSLDSMAPADTQVSLDGVRLTKAVLETLLPLDPGQHVIVISAPNYEAKKYTLSLLPSQQATLLLKLGKRLEGKAEDAPSEPGASQRAIGWVLIGTGAAGSVGALVTGLLARAARDRVAANCEDSLCNPEGARAARQGETLVPLNAISWGVAIAGLGVGIPLVVLAPSSAPEQEPRLIAQATSKAFVLNYQGRF